MKTDKIKAAGRTPAKRVASVGAPVYDLVILNGRVVDPESQRDAVRNIGIT